MFASIAVESPRSDTILTPRSADSRAKGSKNSYFDDENDSPRSVGESPPPKLMRIPSKQRLASLQQTVWRNRADAPTVASNLEQESFQGDEKTAAGQWKNSSSEKDNAEGWRCCKNLFRRARVPCFLQPFLINPASSYMRRWDMCMLVSEPKKYLHHTCYAPSHLFSL